VPEIGARVSGVPLTPRQRDFLASYSDDVLVSVISMSMSGWVWVDVLEGDVGDDRTHVAVPPEGFPDQPKVRLHDADGT